MAKFFNFFPQTLYTPDNKSSGLDVVTNIIARINFESSLKENAAAFYEYSVQESDTPEIIASKFYDSPERHWIVLLFNDIMDPQYDWPLQYNQFIKFVDTKYASNGAANTTVQTGLAWAMNVNNVHSYYKIITRTNSDDEQFVETIQVDSTVYANTPVTTSNYTLQDGTKITETVTKKTQTYYEYEVEQNENKRTIKLLKPEFVPQIEKEFKKAIKQ